MTTTDTPRTDAELEKPRDGVYSSFFSMASHAKQLEQELNASQAEVERLKAELHRSAALMAETGREETARRILERAFGTKDELVALKEEIK